MVSCLEQEAVEECGIDGLAVISSLMLFIEPLESKEGAKRMNESIC